MPDRQVSRYYHITRMWREYLKTGDVLPQADRWLTQYFRANKGFGGKDRKFYSDVFFASLRHGISILRLWYSEQLKNADLTPEEYPRHLLDIPDSFFFTCLTRLHPGLPLTINDPDRRVKLSRNGDFKDNSLPRWLQHHLLQRARQSQWPVETQKTFTGMLDSKPPLYLRINHLSRKTELLEELKSEGFSITEFENGFSLAVAGNPSVFHLKSFKAGLFEIQDLASQAIGAALDVHPGMMVWDACAGGGGKTMQIASYLEGRGRVYASDIREYKLQDVKKRARKGGFSNVTSFVWDGQSVPELAREVAKKKGFHRVLVDAPCSAAGTLRRNPDVRYRISPDSMPGLTELQSSLLANAARAVKPGGRLVYATCSFIVDENEAIVNQFLKNNPAFQLLEMKMHGSPHQNADTMFTAELQFS